ncbi:MAG: ribonuclease HII, partial [Clostridia bacterium]|nr:ribonuclease HII [Clostridia bacterium]
MAKEKTVPTYELEEAWQAEGYPRVCGIDEAGRGPLAGPVFAAAVVLKPGTDLPGLNDSKKLTAKKRDELFELILEAAEDYSVASATEKEIDELNILQATFLAMNRAFDGL